jgi:hypothetical protein
MGTPSASIPPRRSWAPVRRRTLAFEDLGDGRQSSALEGLDRPGRAAERRGHLLDRAEPDEAQQEHLALRRPEPLAESTDALGGERPLGIVGDVVGR